MSLQPLPVDEFLPRLIAALRANSACVLRAPTGSGKTTRVPPALLDAGLAGDGAIVMLEPRRVAARAAARRIAWERGGEVGGEVGYQVRFDQKVGPKTRIKIVTDGVLLRMLQDDPFLERVGVVIFDEFHERGLNADLALAMVRRVQQTVRPELKIVVMSATLDAAAVTAFLGGCPAIEAEGRLFPVEIRYRPQPGLRPSAEAVAAAVSDVIQSNAGDALVFLPGVAEIRREAEALEPLAQRHDLAVMELYGDLPPEQQDAVLARGERRKVVLATNVAETSITIEGVTAVVDTGLARVLRFDPAVGLDRLELARISRASADQRAGRAGRTEPGVCVRLWSEREQQSRPEHEEPEVRRVDLAGPVLELAAWGEPDAAAFPWFEPPPRESLERAKDLLERLGAVASGRITELGAAMARLPVHPRIARLLVEGERLGAAREAALAAALLSERDPFTRERFASTGHSIARSRHRSESDVIDRIAAIEAFERTGRVDSPVGQLNIAAARFALRARDQLLRLTREAKLTETRSVSEESAAESVQRALLVAFPDRVARRREPGGRRGVMVGGRGVRLDERSAVLDAELFVCVDVDAGAGESLVRIASAIERDWLPAERLVTRNEVTFDAANERVVCVRRTCWEDLVLDEAVGGSASDEAIAEVLAEAAAKDFDRVLPSADDPLWSYLARLRCLREWMPQLGLPDLVARSDTGLSAEAVSLHELLSSVALGCRSFADLRRAEWLQFVKGRLTPSQLAAVEREAPERLEVPSGSRIALQYEPGRPPVLAARIQELFGLRETPRVAGGHVAVLLHLLAPNMRPQQVTDDLRSFWDNVYPKLRREMQRRYPKHSWPENPWTATPQRRPGRR